MNHRDPSAMFLIPLGSASTNQPGAGVEHELRIATRPCLSHLPREIWLVILSEYQSITRHAVVLYASNGSLPPGYRERHRILRALSQVCRVLRFTIMPFVWEHIEACVWEDNSIERSRFIAYVLKRQCQGLCKQISRPLAAFVG